MLYTNSLFKSKELKFLYESNPNDMFVATGFSRNDDEATVTSNLNVPTGGRGYLGSLQTGQFQNKRNRYGNDKQITAQLAEWPRAPSR